MSLRAPSARRQPSRALRLGRRTLGLRERLPWQPVAGRLDASPRATGDPRTMACAVLLAFADLGIHLPSRCERLLARVRGADGVGSEGVVGFLDLCLDADLLVSPSPGCVQLSREEAVALERSLDGASPVPEMQASRWVDRLTATVA